jgi:hypothetical protein
VVPLVWNHQRTALPPEAFTFLNSAVYLAMSELCSGISEANLNHAMFTPLANFGWHVALDEPPVPVAPPVAVDEPPAPAPPVLAPPTLVTLVLDVPPALPVPPAPVLPPVATRPPVFFG